MEVMTVRPPLRCILCLVVAALAVFAAVGCDSGDPVSGDTSSERWTSLGNPFRTDYVRAVAVDDARTFYMANYEGLYTSRDDGGTWEKTLD
ncbi:MAG TPA: hypothetical protein VMX58_03935, partial [Patescibacteria group bacterium]|nr:hypothetical protein [Patescibacteria group bacterium]